MSLEGHAEVMKLARLLATPPERLAYLERLDPAEVRELRERATVRLYDDDRRLGRVALASKIPPAPVTAWIAQHLFGALLCARVAGLLETRRAVDLAKRMPPEFLADLAVQLDPRRARDIIFALPPSLIAKVAALLNRRDEHIAMGRFVGHMTDAALRAAFAVLDDGALLRISYFVEEKDQLDHVVGLLEVDRVRGAIRAATEEDLWPQALDLLTRVTPERAGWLADLAAEEDDSVLDGLVFAAQRDGLWDVVLPVTKTMTEAGRQRFAQLPALHAPEVLVAVVDAAIVCDLLQDLLPLAALLPDGARQVIADHAPDALLGRRSVP
jgi:hypothetical protein